jgi:hypothetical protein
MWGVQEGASTLFEHRIVSDDDIRWGFLLLMSCDEFRVSW